MRKYNFLLPLTLTATLLVWGVIALAQEPQPISSDTAKTTTDIYSAEKDAIQAENQTKAVLALEDTVVAPEPKYFMKEITVTASRYEKSSFRVPNSVYVISQDKKEKADPQIIVDLLRNAPGVEVVDAGPFNTRPVIRGLMGSKILLLVDGERLNDTRESPFSGAQLSLVDIDEVERIEVVNGPGTVLYGSDALGGVVNVITKKASFSQSGDIKLGAAYKFRYSTTGDQKKNRLDLRASSSKWALNLGGSFRKVPNNYLTAEGSSKDSSVTNSTLEEESEVGLSLGYKLTDNQTFLLDAQRNRDFEIGFAGFSPLSHPFRQRDKLSLAYDGKNLLESIPSIRIKGYYQELTKIFQGKFGPTVSQTNTDIKLWGVNSQNLLILPPYQTITFGVDYNRELVRGGRLFFLAQPKTILDDNPVVPRVNWDFVGVYAQNEITPLNKLSFFLGGRFDYSRALPLETSGLDTSVQNSLPDVKTERFLSLSAGTVYRIHRGFSVNANLARAYRIPNIVERYFFGPGDLGTWVVPNYDLGREKSISLDFGFKADLDKFSGSLNYFFSEIDDFVDLGPVPDSFYQGRQVWQWKNLSGRTRILGIESALEGSLTKEFYGFVNASWIWGQQRRNSEEQKADSAGAFEVFFVPPFKAYFGLGWREAKNRFWAEASTRMVRKQKRIPTTGPNPPLISETSRFAIYNFKGGINLFKKHSLVVALNNITDKYYVEPYNQLSASANNIVAVPEPGRNFSVSLVLKY